jgi:uncharacterized protein (TIGR02117 family)
MASAAAMAGALSGLVLLALVGGAVVPRNADWREAPEGTTIGIDATAVHAELILPVSAAGHDWRSVLPPGSVPPGVTHLAFSWGDAAFFQGTPDWGRFNARLAIAALFDSRGSLVHLYRLERPAGRPIRLSPTQYRRLAAFLEAEIAAGPALPGYGPEDIFLAGRNRYSWSRTCNNWTADALAAAGVRVGLWTPFAQGLMWRFKQEPTREGRRQ